MEKRDKDDVPYVTVLDGDELALNQRDILIHSFELTAAQKLPAPMLRAIGRHPHVWWTHGARQ